MFNSGPNTLDVQLSGGVSSPVITTPGIAAETPAPRPGEGVIRAMITVPRPRLSANVAALALVPASKLLAAAAATPVGPTAMGSLGVALLRNYVSESLQSYERLQVRIAVLHATGVASATKNHAGKVPPKRDGARVAIDLMVVAQTAEHIRCTQLHQIEVVLSIAFLAEACA